jgi:hypothetical protein
LEAAFAGAFARLAANKRFNEISLSLDRTPIFGAPIRE